MKQYIVKASSLLLLAAAISTGAMAQEKEKEKTKDKEKSGEYDEIVIRKKKDAKDSKVVVEIKDGSVTVNGKPVEDFEDDNVTVRKRKTVVGQGGYTITTAPGAPRSAFRGGTLSYSGDDQLFTTVNKAYLGVMSEKNEYGAKVTEVTDNSGAEKAGLKKDDIITKINDDKVSSPEDLTKAIGKYKPEEKVTVSIRRDGKEQKLTATLGKRSNSFTLASPNYNFNEDAFRFNQDFAPFFNNGRPRLGIKAQETEEGKGLKVLDVDDESNAAKAGIKENDIITEFDGKAVNSTSDLLEASKSLSEKSSVKVKLTRDGKNQEVEIKIPKKLKTANL